MKILPILLLGLMSSTITAKEVPLIEGLPKRLYNSFVIAENSLAEDENNRKKSINSLVKIMSESFVNSENNNSKSSKIAKNRSFTLISSLLESPDYNSWQEAVLLADNLLSLDLANSDEIFTLFTPLFKVYLNTLRTRITLEDIIELGGFFYRIKPDLMRVFVRKLLESEGHQNGRDALFIMTSEYYILDKSDIKCLSFFTLIPNRRINYLEIDLWIGAVKEIFPINQDLLNEDEINDCFELMYAVDHLVLVSRQNQREILYDIKSLITDTFK